MQEPSRSRNASNEILTLGEELRVHRLGFGAMRLCGPGVWGWPADRDNALAVLRRVVALGVTFIDTAEAYGPAVNEEQIFEALHPYPENLVIATKGGTTRSGPGQWGRDCRPQRLKHLCEQSLQRLGLDRIDLYQLHAVDRDVPFEDQIGALRDLRDAGKIRLVGLSNVTSDQLRRAEEIVPIASVQNEYNVGTRISDGIVDYCERKGMAFISYFPLDGGDMDAVAALRPIAQAHGATIWQIALAWLLARSPAIVAIPGTSSIAHLEENAAAASLRLSDDELASLDGIGR
jgi:pyridoxine 4-dehydrogenase